MKNLFFLMSLATAFTASSQCCPYVQPIEVIPSYPDSDDSIFVITDVTTPNQGDYLGYQIIDMGDTIRIEACYYNGLLTALENYTDTINIGVWPAGDYIIEFMAYISNDQLTCTYSDSNNVYDTLVVTQANLGMPQPVAAVKVYPNPVNNGLIHVETNTAGENLTYRLYNLAGQVEQEGTLPSSGIIRTHGLKGVCFLQLNGPKTNRTIRVILQ